MFEKSQLKVMHDEYDVGHPVSIVVLKKHKIKIEKNTNYIKSKYDLLAWKELENFYNNF